MKYSACVEMLFASEAPDVPARIRLAHAAGFRLVEFWRWTNKDLDAIELALRQTGIRLAGLVAEPMVPLTDPTHHVAFLEGLVASIVVAQRLGAATLIAQAGNEIDGVPRPAQRDAIIGCLKLAARTLHGTGVVLALEPLNTRIDHPGYFLSSTVEGLDIIDQIDSPEIRLLYDIYHSHVMGEASETVLAGRIDRIRHVHLADAPGRHEPGSGKIDWQHAIATLQAGGYTGPVGLEFRPTGPTMASLSTIGMGLGK